MKPSGKEKHRKFIVSVSVEVPCRGFDEMAHRICNGSSVAVKVSGHSVMLEGYELEPILGKARKLMELLRSAGCEPFLTVSILI